MVQNKARATTVRWPGLARRSSMVMISRRRSSSRAGRRYTRQQQARQRHRRRRFRRLSQRFVIAGRVSSLRCSSAIVATLGRTSMSENGWHAARESWVAQQERRLCICNDDAVVDASHTLIGINSMRHHLTHSPHRYSHGVKAANPCQSRNSASRMGRWHADSLAACRTHPPAAPAAPRLSHSGPFIVVVLCLCCCTAAAARYHCRLRPPPFASCPWAPPSAP